MKKIICIMVLLGLALVPSAAQAYWLDIGAGYWSAEPTGSIAYSGATAGTAVDLDTDMGLEKEGFAHVRAKVDLPLLNIAFMATPMEYEGSGTASFDFGGTTYSTPYDTTLTMNHYDVALFWGIPFLETLTADMLNVEFGLNARMLDFETSVDDGTNVESQDISATIPMVYLAAQFRPIDSFNIEAEIRGLSIGDNKYTDTIARLKWRPIPLFNISAGYRAQKLELDDSGIVSDMEFKGPFAELGLQF